MAINAATLNIGIGVTGEGTAVAALQRVNAAVGKTGDKIGRAARTAANFGASMAQAGATSATALAGIAQQAGEIAFAFGPAGAVAGAVATATIAIVALVRRSRKEVQDMKDEFKRSIDELANAGDYAALNKKARDILYGTVSDPGGLAALQQKRADLRAQLDKAVRERNLFLVSKLQQGIKDLDEKIKPIREQYDLVVQRIMTPDLRPGVQGLQQVTTVARDFDKLAADAIRERARAVRELAEAQAALAKASEGITLTGPAVDLGIGDLSHAPQVPVQVVPQFTVDNAHILALQEQIKQILEAEFNQKTLAVNLEFAKFGTNVVESLANSLGEAAGHGFENAGGIVLAALGGIFKKMGSALIAYGAAMKALLPHLLNPFTSGPAAIAAGALLVALGTALSGLATGTGGGGSGGGFSSNVGEVTQAAQVTNITVGASGTQRTAAGLTPMQPVNFTVIGTNDPTAQRDIVDLLDNARRRGL